MSHKLISNDFIPILKKLCLNFGNNFDEVINLLFNEVNKIYGIDNLAFFRKVHHTLEFEIYKSFGNKHQSYWEKLYQTTIDDGSIGILLATCSVVSVDISDKKLKLYPIFNENDFFGFILIDKNEGQLPEDAEFDDFLIICSSYLTNKIAHLELQNKLSELEQNMQLHIASRTINLVKNNQQLSEKIKGLCKNLCMALPHEFRTPLNQILGNSDLLMKHFDVIEPNEAKDIVSDIYTSCRRLQNLIEHYLVLSQLELILINIDQLDEIRSSKTHSVETSIYNVLSSKSEYESRYKDFHIELEDASIQISENFFVIMMTELIDNATKYSEQGKPIIINTKVENDYLNLIVTDFGMGINKEDLDKIDAYTQFDRDKFEQQGLGLGLAIVYRIVDITNSKIKIESEVNNYTRIEIKIPIAKD